MALLRACDEEGEDLPFSILLEVVREALPSCGALVEELEARYGHFPPRVALAKMSGDPSWRRALEMAAEAYLPELLEG